MSSIESVLFPESWRSVPLRLTTTSREGDRLTLRAGEFEGEPCIYVTTWNERDFPIGGGGAGGGTRLKRKERLRFDLGSFYEEGKNLYMAGRASKEVEAVVATLDDGSTVEAHLVQCADLPYNVFIAVPPAERWVVDVRER